MSSYRIILKTTSLYGGLRIITILMNIGVSKIIAIFVGVNGIGLYGIYTSALGLITSIADLGVSKSAIRNIAETAEEKNEENVSEIISLVRKLVFWTGSVGAIATILFSRHISQWSFGNSSYWLSFVLIGIAVFFTITNNGQQAIFQGLRRYKLISKSTIISSVLGFLVSLPLIYFYGEKGIVYSLVSLAFISFLVSRFYIRQIGYSSTFETTLTKSKSFNIIKLGLSLMLVSFLVSLSGYLIRTYISLSGSINDVGYFQAGFQIISGYFGIIFTSMTTDFFPRISAINKDNAKLEREVNQQAIVTVLLICPLVVLLPYIMPLVISVLYSKEFVISIDYVNIALFGIIFQAGSQTMGMILLAKNNAKVFVSSVFLFQLQFLILNIVGYYYYGILGLGLTFSINMLIYLIVIQLIIYKIYKIRFYVKFLKHIIAVFLFGLGAFYSRNFEIILRVFIGTTLIIASLWYTIFYFKKILEIKSILEMIKNKIRKS